MTLGHPRRMRRGWCAVLQDTASYAVAQETLALLKVLAITTQAANDGKRSPAADAYAHRALKTFPPSSTCDTLE